MTFTPDITLGGIFNGLLVIFAVGMAWGAFKYRLDRMDSQLVELKDVLIVVATQKVELEALGRRVNDIQEHGSHRLELVLSEMRNQLSVDFENRIGDLQRVISGRD